MDYIKKALELRIIKSPEEAIGYQARMLSAETAGRLECIAALTTINASLVIKQAPLTEPRYDMWTTSGDTVVAIETKDRNISSDRYQKIGVSQKKWDMLLNIEKAPNRMILFCETFTDGKAMFWDVNNTPYTIKQWVHSRYEEKPGNTITEGMIELDPKDAKYVVRYDRIRRG